MAIIKKQVLGTPVKSVGDIVFASVNGQTVAKSKPASYNDANSPDQQLVRNTMKASVELHKMLEEIAKIGFRGRPQTQSPYNAFIANLTKKGGIKENKPALELCENQVDFTKHLIETVPVLVQGNTNNLIIESVTLTESGENITATVTAEDWTETIKTGVICEIIMFDVRRSVIIKKVHAEIDAFTKESTATTEKGKSNFEDIVVVAMLHTPDCKYGSNSSTYLSWLTEAVAPPPIIHVESVVIDLDGLPPIISYGTERDLFFKIEPTNATNQDVTWLSSKNTIISIDQNGHIIAMDHGTSEIVITTADGGKTDSVEFTVP